MNSLTEDDFPPLYIRQQCSTTFAPSYRGYPCRNVQYIRTPLFLNAYKYCRILLFFGIYYAFIPVNWISISTPKNTEFGPDNHTVYSNYWLGLGYIVYIQCRMYITEDELAGYRRVHLLLRSHYAANTYYSGTWFSP